MYNKDFYNDILLNEKMNNFQNIMVQRAMKSKSVKIGVNIGKNMELRTAYKDYKVQGGKLPFDEYKKIILKTMKENKFKNKSNYFKANKIVIMKYE